MKTIARQQSQRVRDGYADDSTMDPNTFQIAPYTNADQATGDP
jgi:hypothetical protein